MYNKAIMALIYFYDATELDRAQLTNALKDTDHHWEFVDEKISLNNIVPEAEVVSVFVSSQIDREMMEAMPNLKLIACRSTGFNNIDMQTASERNITVANVPSYGESTVAEYAFTLMLSLMRKIEDVLKAENSQISQGELMGNDLCGKTLGVIGTGRIGQHTIKIGNGFLMNVIGYDAYPKDELQSTLNFKYQSMDDLLINSDIVTIHAPYLPTTHHLINAEKLALMKPSAILINTARGEIVDTSALVESLNNGLLAGAALDVIEGEVLLNHTEEVALLRSHEINPEMMRHSVEISLLKTMPNVIISPHNAFNTIEAVERINNTTAKNIIDYWYGDTPNKVITPPKTNGKLLVVRHTESEWNALGQWTGTRDIHLSENGFRLSGQMGLLLKTLNIPIDIAYCSQQIRTRETLQGILDGSQQFDVEVLRDEAINERDYGDYTGKNKWDMKNLVGEEAWMNIRRGWDTPIPNGETLKTVYERVVPFYENVLLPLIKNGKNVLMVAHGNSIRALMKYLESISDEEVGDLEMLFGQIVVYDISDDGKMKSKIVNSIESPVKQA